MSLRQLQMTVELNPKCSFNPKHLTRDSPVPHSSIRPLGLLRNVRDLNEVEGNDDNPSPDCDQPLDDTETEHAKQIKGTTNHKLPALQTPKETKSPKKIIQLPMLKLNLESITGTSFNEDNKTLEDTRRTLKTLLNESKREVQAAQIKNYHFITPTDNSDQQSYNRPGENNPMSLKKRKQSVSNTNSPLHLPAVDKHQPSTWIPNSRTSSKTPDAISSVALTNCVDIIDTDTYTDNYMYCDGFISYSTRNLNSDNDFTKDLIIDLAKGPTSSSRIGPVNFFDMAAWPSYEDIRQTRKGGNTGCSKHEYILKKHRFQAELMEERIRARRDLALSWVNINNSGYKASPILRYTNYQGTQILPLTLASRTSDHCPMCALYRTERLPTPCPPNSPTRHALDSTNETELLNGDALRDSHPETAAVPSHAHSTGHFKDVHRLEPVSSSRMAKKQGFRGSKTPISFRMAFSKGT